MSLTQVGLGVRLLLLWIYFGTVGISHVAGALDIGSIRTLTSRP